ncbi:MAG: V-type ATP synthase subunit D [Thermoleophilaceae bacterium]
MKVRHPPGRAGRPWLAHRLEVARRGAELLDEKFRALIHERSRLEPEVAEARGDWERRARAAELWLTRAAVLGGEHQLEAAAALAVPADVTVRWRVVLGVACPAETSVEPDAGAPPGGSAALLSAVEAHRLALEAAVRVAAGEAALRRIDDELLATRLRRNAIERNWIPAHEAALSALELTLEELEREDGTRLRRVTRAAREW